MKIAVPSETLRTYITSFALFSSSVYKNLILTLEPNLSLKCLCRFCGSLIHYLCFPGDKFFCRIALPTIVGEDGTTASVLCFCYVLLDCSCICEEKCSGNQRKVTSRNWNSTPPSTIICINTKFPKFHEDCCRICWIPYSPKHLFNRCHCLLHSFASTTNEIPFL